MSSPEELLHAAIDDGRLPEAAELLSSGASVNCFLGGLTPTARAIRRGDLVMVDLLLQYRPNLHLGQCLYALEEGPQDAEGQGGHRGERRVPLLLLAVEAGRPDMVRRLLVKGADPNESENTQNESALHLAVKKRNPDIVRVLLEFEAYVNRLDSKSNAPLHHAVRENLLGVARLLLTEGALVNLPDDQEQFPLHLAASAGNLDMVGLLLEHGAFVSIQDGKGWTALHHAASSGRGAVTRLLLTQGPGGGDVRTDGGETALSLACDGQHVGVVDALLREGRVDPRLGAGRGASCRLPLQIAAATGNQEILELLLDCGASVNQRDLVHGETALHWAVRHRQTWAVDILLQRRANPNIPDIVCGHTPLHIACNLNFNGSFLDIVQKLIKNRGNVNLTEKGTLDTALHIAARNGCTQVVNALLQTTFDVNVNVRNMNGETPLMVAAKSGHRDVIAVLVNAGSRLNELSVKDKDNALHIAIQRSYFDIAMQLLKYGCNVNQENAYQETPLSLLLSEIVSRSPIHDETIVDLLYSMVSVGARLGSKSNTKYIKRQISQIGNSGAKLPSTIYMCLHPPRLLHSCVARIRHHLTEIKENMNIIPSISKLPLPIVLKQNVSLSFE